MKRLIALACLVLVLAVGFLLVRNPSPSAPAAPVLIMPMPYSIPPQKISLFDAWVPRKSSWAWLWRLKEQILGRPKTCDFAATVVDFSRLGPSFLTKHSLAAPRFSSTNGIEVWFLDDATLTALREDARKTASDGILSVARIMTADGMQARLFSGNTIMVDGLPTSLGLAVDLLPRVRRDSTDITTIITYSEAITNQPGVAQGSSQTATVSVQTNLAVAARIQVPKGAGVLLLDGPAATTNHKRLGVILVVNSPSPKS